MITPRVRIGADDVADHYDELDRLYRHVWGEHVHHGLWLTGKETVPQATRNLAVRVADALSLLPDQHVCDIGCGYGATSRLLAEGYGVRVTGITLSRAQFEFAQAATRANNPRYLCADFLSKAFDAGSLDAAVAIESTEHFEDKQRLFEEMLRILRPGGRIGVCAWLASETLRPWEVRYLLDPICREGRLPGLGSETDYRELIARAGFADVRMEDITASVARTWPIIVRRVLARLPWDPATWRFLVGRPKNAIFGVTISRIALAYRTGAMRYGIFTARKPNSPD